MRGVDVLGPNPTNTCFGGRDGCAAYVTEAKNGASSDSAWIVPARPGIAGKRISRGLLSHANGKRRTLKRCGWMLFELLEHDFDRLFQLRVFARIDGDRPLLHFDVGCDA